MSVIQIFQLSEFQAQKMPVNISYFNYIYLLIVIHVTHWIVQKHRFKKRKSEFLIYRFTHLIFFKKKTKKK